MLANVMHAVAKHCGRSIQCDDGIKTIPTTGNTTFIIVNKFSFHANLALSIQTYYYIFRSIILIMNIHCGLCTRHRGPKMCDVRVHKMMRPPLSCGMGNQQRIVLV